MNKNDCILNKVYKLVDMYSKGLLKGEVMPEDSNPMLPLSSLENFAYFTLPMALNYQRNSYKLWESAKETYLDHETSKIFDISFVCKISDEEIRHLLLKYKLALQPQRHIEIWKTLCRSFNDNFNADIRNLFIQNDNDVKSIKNYISCHKKMFPYLGGDKILNYWLYVIEQRTGILFKNRRDISVAPDTHVIKSSINLGLISEDDANKNNIREVLNNLWSELLKDTDLQPIDIHTPLWLWSRGGFQLKL